MKKQLLFISISAIFTAFFVSTSIFAAPPMTSIQTPDDGSSVNSSPLTVSGTFSADTAVTKIGVVVCRATAGGVCNNAYVQNTSGTLGKTWTALSANRTSADGKTGTYRLDISGLAPDYYRIAVFAADAITPKGPRAVSIVRITEAAPTDPSYITVMWGRSNWQATNGCKVPAGARTLEENAIDMRARGVFGVGGVVIDRTDETERPCVNGITTQSSWQDLARLRDNYNWKFISQSKTYADLTLLSTEEERYQETGATLPFFEAHGHMRAWGAFNYPNDKQNLAVQQTTMRYFAFGRKYDTGKNTRTSVSSFPYTMNTRSINGGKCFNTELPCNKTKLNLGGRTTPVPDIIDILNPSANGWGVVQAYRLVEGKNGTLGQPMAWDCTSPRWQDRWTSKAEVYCRNSFLQALDGRSTAATVADPATVAEAWNVLPNTR